MCIYLSNSQLVDDLIGKTVTVKNKDITIKRLKKPPARKIIISNVYSSIPNEVIENSIHDLGFKVMSPVRILSAGLLEDDYRHVESFRRQVLISPCSDQSELPSSILISHEDAQFRVFLCSDDMNYCYLCKLPGHVARKCPNNPPSRSASNEQSNLETSSMEEESSEIFKKRRSEEICRQGKSKDYVENEKPPEENRVSDFLNKLRTFKSRCLKFPVPNLETDSTGEESTEYLQRLNRLIKNRSVVNQSLPKSQANGKTNIERSHSSPVGKYTAHLAARSLSNISSHSSVQKSIDSVEVSEISLKIAKPFIREKELVSQETPEIVINVISETEVAVECQGNQSESGEKKNFEIPVIIDHSPIEKAEGDTSSSFAMIRSRLIKQLQIENESDEKVPEKKIETE